MTTQSPRPPSCPLCGSTIAKYTVDSNHREQRDHATGKLLGFAPGNPSMNAVCERGCEIRVAASQPLAGAHERFEEEKPPTPRTCGYEKDPTETEE